MDRQLDGWIVLIVISVTQPGRNAWNIYREPEFQNFTISGCVSKKVGIGPSTVESVPMSAAASHTSLRPSRWSLCVQMDQFFPGQYMWINACFCNLSCRNPNDIFADLEQYYEVNEIVN